MARAIRNLLSFAVRSGTVRTNLTEDTLNSETLT